MLCEKGLSLSKPFSLNLPQFHQSPPGMQYCRHCGRDLPLAEFWKGNPTCRSCKKGQKGRGRTHSPRGWHRYPSARGALETAVANGKRRHLGKQGLLGRTRAAGGAAGVDILISDHR